MALIASTDQVQPPNKAPEWTSTPDITFAPGVGGTYALSQDTFDQEGDSLTYVKTAGSWPANVSMDTAGLITATDAVVEESQTGIIVTVDDGTASPVASPSFSVVITNVTAWPVQDAWPGIIPSVRNRNGSGVTAAGRGFGAGGADGAAGRHAYRQFNVGAQTGTAPAIYHVTTRNSTGAGSLREGIDQETGPRIIVFDVGGQFDITNNNYIDSGDIWIAGQTAPSQVVINQTVVGKSQRIRAGNVFIQHCIIWHSALPEFPGQDAGNNDNVYIMDPQINPDFSNVLFSNCSFGGGTDQVFLINDGCTNITFADCLFYCPRGKDPAESVGNNFHQYVMNIGGNSSGESPNFVSMIGCVFEDGFSRCPQAVIENAAFVNLLIYNREEHGLVLRGKSTEDMTHKINVVGVWDRRGADYDGTFQTGCVSLGRINGAQSFDTNSEIYVTDCVNDVTTVVDEWDVVGDPDSQEGDVRVNSEIAVSWPTGLVAASMRDESIADRLTLMTQNVGPRPNARITHTQDVIDDIVNGTGSRQADYAIPVGSDTSSAYSEPGNPHTQGSESGRSVIEEDLLDKAEAFLV